MEFTTPLIPGTLVRRYKRFLADINLHSGEAVTAHCPNSGSMRGCYFPGNPVMVTFHDFPSRKLKYTWELIRVDNLWIGINTQHPNLLVKEAIIRGRIGELNGYQQIRREVKISNESRIDLVLESDSQKCFIEVKNVTLVENGIAFFPDAVTLRGQKHLKELVKLKKSGYRAIIFFVIQRTDSTCFRPADHIDPDYGKLLRLSVENGVEILCYDAEISTRGIWISKSIPVCL
ncbi:MAG: DNA/RNA nuclease SfsA [Calditrichaeota bacterium]|nr:DNA/RNA nuclease SfsA [Calditrichota bacterium]RQV93517.1 MAG: DNA/RNA nuclease SfsA [bacterium]RQW06431.1 MAG: DNA/RNA nuclease SfsA [Calditrichota bacterium]